MIFPGPEVVAFAGFFIARGYRVRVEPPEDRHPKLETEQTDMFDPRVFGKVVVSWKQKIRGLDYGMAAEERWSTIDAKGGLFLAMQVHAALRHTHIVALCDRRASPDFIVERDRR